MRWWQLRDGRFPTLRPGRSFSFCLSLISLLRGGPREAVERSKGQRARASEREREREREEKWQSGEEREGEGVAINWERLILAKRKEIEGWGCSCRGGQEGTHPYWHSHTHTHTPALTHTCRQQQHSDNTYANSCTTPMQTLTAECPASWPAMRIALMKMRVMKSEGERMPACHSWGPEPGSGGRQSGELLEWDGAQSIEHMHLHVCMCMSVCMCVSVWNVCVKTRMPPQRGTS